MSSSAEIESPSVTPSLTAAADYLGLTAERRYAVVSQKFPAWLLAEPITFPEHDRTYGWACRVLGCDAAPTDMQRQAMCWQHSHDYRQVKDSLSADDFLRQAKPRRSQLGRGLTRRTDCRICGSNREARQLGFCRNHFKNYDLMRRRRGFDENT
jgi:hypothetical protein